MESTKYYRVVSYKVRSNSQGWGYKSKSKYHYGIRRTQYRHNSDNRPVILSLKVYINLIPFFKNDNSEAEPVDSLRVTQNPLKIQSWPI